MPPKYLFDISNIDLSRVLFGHDAIREMNPQRGHMEHLDGIVYADPEAGRIGINLSWIQAGFTLEKSAVGGVR